MIEGLKKIKSHLQDPTFLGCPNISQQCQTPSSSCLADCPEIKHEFLYKKNKEYQTRDFSRGHFESIAN